MSRHGSAWRDEWRSKDGRRVPVKPRKRKRAPPFQVSVRPATRDAVRARARALGTSSRCLADAVINAALDKAGAP
jgi:hypothetical protein